MQLRALRVVYDFSIFAEADAHDFAQRLPVRVLHHRMIELSACHKIDVRTSIQRLIRLDVPVRPNKSNFQAWVGFLDFPDQLDVAFQTDRGCEEHQEFVVFTDLDGLLPIDFVGRSVQQPASGDNSRRVRQQHRVPVGLNLPCRRPTPTRTAVEILEARRIHQQCFHYIRHSSPSVSRNKIIRPNPRFPRTAHVMEGSRKRADWSPPIYKYSLPDFRVTPQTFLSLGVYQAANGN